MLTVPGTYKNGRIRLSRKPRTRKPTDVTVVFHPRLKGVLSGLTAKQMQKLVSLAHLGGDALQDTERLYS